MCESSQLFRAASRIFAAKMDDGVGSYHMRRVFRSFLSWTICLSRKKAR